VRRLKGDFGATKKVSKSLPLGRAYTREILSLQSRKGNISRAIPEQNAADDQMQLDLGM
jgi:hypothetical protein